jgi:predicted transcriptional regulator
VILVDNNTRRFVGAIDISSLLKLPFNDLIDFTKAINEANRAYLVRFPEFVFKNIRNNKTNAQALKEMQNLDVKTLVVLNERDEPVAIVRQDQILNHILEKLHPGC